MRAELAKGDEGPRQYLVLTPQTLDEERFLERLRKFWHLQDR